MFAPVGRVTLVTTAYDERVIGCAIEVHRRVGPGIYESPYGHCLAHELTKAGIPFRRQAPIPLRYDELEFACVFKADFIVAGELIVEIKAVERLLDLHFAQVLTYLRCSGLKKGLLLNFNATRLVVRSVVLS